MKKNAKAAMEAADPALISLRANSTAAAAEEVSVAANRASSPWIE
jgi:hypothetical protein